jgi:glutamate-ammonia-ligase adenylyltransferase
MSSDFVTTQPLRELLDSFLPGERVNEWLPRLARLIHAAPQVGKLLSEDRDILPELVDVAESELPPGGRSLRETLRTAGREVTSASQANRLLRNRRDRALVHIAYADIVRDWSVERVCQQLAELADAVLEAALEIALRLTRQRRAQRGKRDAGALPPLAALAYGSYGGRELGYERRLDVLFIADLPGTPAGASETAEELIEQWLGLTRAILDPPQRGQTVYQLHQRLNLSEGTEKSFYDAGELARVLDRSGRTWHRQTMVKTRAAAGNTRWAAEWIAQRHAWVYRRYWGSADQAGIRAAKHKLRRIAADSSPAEPGKPPVRPLEASREVESVTQFLQLLNGTDLPQLRIGNTLHAIEALEQAGCLTMRERTLLCEHYTELRRIGNRLQLATWQANMEAEALDSRDAWQRAAEGMRVTDAHGNADARALQTDALQRHRVCQRIIDHLVHDVFPDAAELPFETEMVLDPEVDLTAVKQLLSGHGFRRPELAFHHILALASEPIPFLSDRRSRHFLAGIAPHLLQEIAATPDPDATLARLVEVSDSLGGKAALWELFQLTPSTLRMGVRLCAASPYLAGILIHNPGMVDELIDSLLLDRLPSSEQLDASSRDLCRFAEDIGPILHSFKNSAHLRIGTRDLLGRDSIIDTHHALADTAEACLRRVSEEAWGSMVERYGEPQDADGRPCRLAIVALGKLGAREPNYHSNLEVLFVYDAEGQTRPGNRRTGTSNSHFFNEMTQRIAKRFAQLGAGGRLYELDAQIRFTHQRQTLAVSVDQFAEHFHSGQAPLWQRLSLVPARLIAAEPTAKQRIEAVIRDALLEPSWRPELAVEAAELRYALEQGASQANIKRGPGGTLDVETIVQLLLLRHASHFDGDLGVGTLRGLELLKRRQWMSISRTQQLATSYKYLRSVESYLRLMNLPARHDLPQQNDPLRQLAYAMRESQPAIVASKCDSYRRRNRQLFQEIIAEQAAGQD